MNANHSSAEQDQTPSIIDQPEEKLRWEAPAVTSFKPVTETQGISYRTGDGLSNLS